MLRTARQLCLRRDWYCFGCGRKGNGVVHACSSVALLPALPPGMYRSRRALALAVTFNAGSYRKSVDFGVNVLTVNRPLALYIGSKSFFCMLYTLVSKRVTLTLYSVLYSSTRSPCFTRSQLSGNTRVPQDAPTCIMPAFYTPTDGRTLNAAGRSKGLIGKPIDKLMNYINYCTNPRAEYTKY